MAARDDAAGPAEPCDGRSRVGAEADVIQLPGVTYQAVVADLDADGVRELVRLIGMPEPSQAVAVDIWAERGNAWVPSGGPVLLRRRPDPAELAGYDRNLVDDSGRLRVATPDWHASRGASHRRIRAGGRGHQRDGQPHLLPLRAGHRALGGPSACCFAGGSAARSRHGAGARRRWRRFDELLTRDAQIRSRDLRDQQLDGTPLRRLRLYRLDQRSVTELAVGAPPIRTQTPFVLGESDGLPGQEAGMIDPAGSGSLARVSWDGSGPLTVERTELFEPTVIASR